MFPLGHIAISLVVSSLTKAQIVPVIAAALIPDVIDKPLCWLLRITPYSRLYNHNLLAVVLLSMVVGLIGGRRQAYSWALGHLGHLVGDGGGGVLPLLFPFISYKYPEERFTPKASQILTEAALLALSLLIYRNGRQKRRIAK